MITDNLFLYKNFKNGEILKNVLKVYDAINTEQKALSEDEIKKLISSIVNSLTRLQFSHGYNGNLWHNYLTFLLVNNENPYSMACEIRGSVTGSINDIALHDYEIFKTLFDIDLCALFSKAGVNNTEYLLNYDGGNDEGRFFNKRIRDRIVDLSLKL